ncbi:MAG: sensor signal transduction histidine [Planctomycetota bacterium]|nr:MAG: sensor signal transduction histidine [Planctomycetota bacterium]
MIHNSYTLAPPSAQPAGARVLTEATASGGEMGRVAAAGEAASRIRRWALGMGVFAALIGCVGMAGWVFGVEALKSVLPGAASMKANTAAAMLAEGLGLALVASGFRKFRGLVIALGGAAAAVGAFTLLEFVLGANFGIDEALARDLGKGGLRYYPGRMAPTTALNFLMLGIAIPLAGGASRTGSRVADALAIPASLIALISLIGNLFRVPADSPVTYHTTQQAVHTAAGFLALSCGALLVNAQRGALRVIAAGGSAGFMARRMLPGSLAVPIAGGLAILLGERAGWYGSQFSSAAVVVAVIAAMTAATSLLANRLAVLDARRRRAERSLERLNRQLESGVQQRTAQLSAANAELEAFCYSISHDLRGPLQTIDGFTAAALEEGGEAAKDHLRRVRSSARQMGEILERLLELSRLSRTQMKPGTVDLSALAQDVIDQIAGANPGRIVSCKVQPGLTAYGDTPLLRVLLRNLLDNAWKFTAATPTPLVEFGATGSGEYFVSDNGTGFDPDAANDRLFRPFHRLHDDPRFPGHGIGLATARRIVERHGGRIRAEGAPGKGATLFFSLSEVKPLAREDHPAR